MRNCELCGKTYEEGGDSWDGLDPECADAVSEFMDANDVTRDEAVKELQCLPYEFYHPENIEPMSVDHLVEYLDCQNVRAHTFAVAFARAWRDKDSPLHKALLDQEGGDLLSHLDEMIEKLPQAVGDRFENAEVTRGLFEILHPAPPPWHEGRLVKAIIDWAIALDSGT